MPARLPSRQKRMPMLARRLRVEDAVERLIAEIERLKSENDWLSVELAEARYSLVDLMDVRGLLDGYAGLDDHESLIAWREKSVERALAAADVRPGESMGDARYGPRALCPLCRSSAFGAAGVRGFAFPEGLRRHLLGESTRHQCVVFAAANKSITRRIREKVDRMGGR